MPIIHTVFRGFVQMRRILLADGIPMGERDARPSLGPLICARWPSRSARSPDSPATSCRQHLQLRSTGSRDRVLLVAKHAACCRQHLPSDAPPPRAGRRPHGQQSNQARSISRFEAILRHRRVSADADFVVRPSASPCGSTPPEASRRRLSSSSRRVDCGRQLLRTRRKRDRTRAIESGVHWLGRPARRA